MALNVKKELAALKRMTTAELKVRYAEVFSEATGSRHKTHLVKRIIWRMQASEEGDLSERARNRAIELANDADLRVTAPDRDTEAEPSKTVKPRFNGNGRLPLPGTVITRDYKGETLRVTVLQNGFEHEGEFYKSLSAVAKAVTGKHWNGYHFFGLRNRRSK